MTVFMDPKKVENGQITPQKQRKFHEYFVAIVGEMKIILKL